MHVASRRVVGCPNADRVLWRRVESPDQLACLCVEGFDESAYAIFAAICPDQNLAVYDCWSHCFAVAELGIGDRCLPNYFTGLRIESDQFRIEGPHIDRPAIDGHTPIVWAAAVHGHRTKLLFVVPEFITGARVERIEVIEGCRNIHDPVHDDWSRLQRLLHFGLEDPSRV